MVVRVVAPGLTGDLTAGVAPGSSPRSKSKGCRRVEYKFSFHQTPSVKGGGLVRISLN